MSSVEHTPPAPPPAPHEDDVRKLRRSRSDRWFAGVCGGLADYFGLNAAVYRILFVALAFAGGAGILLYLAAFLVMPDEQADESVLAERLRRHRDRPWLVIGLALLALVLIFVISDAPGDGPGFGLFLLLLVGGGAALLWSRAARRDARRRDATGRRSVAWRVAALVGVLAIVVGTGAGALAAANAKGGIGERHEQPVSVSELKDEYKIGLGQLELDLSDTVLPRGETRVVARVGFGELDIVLPPDVPVSVTGKVHWGEADELGNRQDGRDTDVRFVTTGFEDAPKRLVIDASVRGGELDVRR